MHKLLFTFVFLLSTLSAGATPVSLETLLDRVNLDPAVTAAESWHRADLKLKEMRESEMGPRAFFGASTGHYRELNSANQISDHYSRNADIGISYPLLGSLKRQLDALEQAQLIARRSELSIAVQRAEQQLGLRMSYANWWRAQQELELCKTLQPQAHTALGEIADRRAAGWMRHSNAAALEQGWQALLERCELAMRQEQAERSLLALMASMSLPSDAKAVVAPLYTRIAPLERWQYAMEGHPDVKDREAELDYVQANRTPPWYNSIESSVSVGLAVEDRSGVSRYGSSVVAALNFSIPLGILTHHRAARDEAHLRWSAARDRLLAEKRQLMIDLAAVLRAHQQSLLTLNDRQGQLTAARLRVSEQQARLELDEGDAIEQLQTSRLAWFQTRFDLLAAVHQLWRQQAELQIFINDAQEARALLGGSTLTWPLGQPDKAVAPTARATQASRPAAPATRQADWTYGVYLWNSHALLSPDTRNQELARLQHAGFTRVYVGLDADQTRRLTDTRRHLQETLSKAARQNMQIYLLLGEPSWIEPEHRQHLLDLIRSLAGLPFTGLHLDLEVEQSGWPVPERRVENWIDTLAAANRVSPWPLEISSHHRWFTPEAPGATCVPCGVAIAGVKGVSLMIYTTNTQRSTALAAQVASSWPRLRIRLAQSVEPQLADTESWAHHSRNDMQQALAQWENDLSPLGVGGVDWQDWNYFSKQDIALGRP